MTDAQFIHPYQATNLNTKEIFCSDNAINIIYYQFTYLVLRLLFIKWSVQICLAVCI